MRSLGLWVVGTIAGGACLPLVDRIGGWGFGALLVLGFCTVFGFVAGARRPRTAAVLVILFTGTASAVNWAASSPSSPGRSPGAFWDLWMMLGVFSGLSMLGGVSAGLTARRPRVIGPNRVP